MKIPSHWHLLPIYSLDEKGNCRCGRVCNSPGKHPITRKGLHEASPEWKVQEQWINDKPYLHMAVRTGPESGIWVLDIDTKEPCPVVRQLIERSDTLTVSTPRGWHLYFKWESRYWIRNRINVKIGDTLVDVRGRDGYVILPWPTNKYKWANDFEIIEASPLLIGKVEGAGLDIEEQERKEKLRIANHERLIEEAGL